MEQEIDIKINIVFLKPQIMDASKLDSILENAIINSKFFMKPTEIKSAINNAHIRITSSISAELETELIKKLMINEVKKSMPMWIEFAEVLELREEAEIYGNE